MASVRCGSTRDRAAGVGRTDFGYLRGPWIASSGLVTNLVVNGVEVMSYVEASTAGIRCGC